MKMPYALNYSSGLPEAAKNSSCAGPNIAQIGVL
jgi:hypothetical protein